MSEEDVEELDAYFTLTSTSMQLMKCRVPWWGRREMDYGSIQILIEVLTTYAYIVLDAYTSTC